MILWWFISPSKFIWWCVISCCCRFCFTLCRFAHFAWKRTFFWSWSLCLWFFIFFALLQLAFSSFSWGAVSDLFCKQRLFRLLSSGSVRSRWVLVCKWLGKLKIVGVGLSLVGANPPSKWAEQILVCLVTFKLLRRQAAIHLSLLSLSFRSKSVESYSLEFWVFQIVFLFLCTVWTIVGTAAMIYHGSSIKRQK